MLESSFTRLVRCTVPVQQAPIGFPAADPALAAAVAAAGGHGMLAAVGMSAAELGPRLDTLTATTRAFGVNFLQIRTVLDLEALELAAARAPMVELYLGMPDPDLVARARADGALVSFQVSSAEEARAAEAGGCDVIVARGIEAGGRSLGGIGLLPLLDAVLDAVSVPVVAAGGIATGRGLAAVLAAGAGAARVGTRFLVADEAATHPDYVEAVLAADARGTVLTERFSAGLQPTPHRVLRSALEAAEAATDETVAEMSVFGERTVIPRFSPHNPADNATGRIDAMALYAGESVGAVTRRQSAAEIVAELATEAERLLAAR